jgi:hypothetical protein
MQKALLVVIFAVAVVGPTAEAGGRIVCKDGYQKINGQEIATPYCQDEYLAAVARQYGSRVSGSDVRKSASLKYELCRFIGHDIRVQGYCPPDSDSYRDR